MAWRYILHAERGFHMKKDTTMKDIAVAANVSVATVSRVINQTGSVSPKLAKRVMRVVREMDFSPNLIAQSLKRSQTSSIAFLVSNISDPFFITLGRGIESILQRSNYSLMVCSTGHTKEQELAFLKMFYGKKVDGIIVNTTGYNDDEISTLSHNIPMVLSNRKIRSSSFVGDFVDNENMGCAYELTKKLLTYGHRRIGIICGPQHLSTGYERYMGFCSALREANIPTEPQYRYKFEGTFVRQTGYDGAKALLRMDEPPTAIVMSSSELAYGAMEYFIKYDIKIPDALSFVCIGDMVNRDLLYVRPTLSSVNLHGMGARMAELLLERIESSEQIPNREIRFASAIVDGDSVKGPSS